MTLVTYRRLADAPPPERELLEVDASGEARVWRSNGSAVGRFGGTVGDLAGLRADLETAEAGDPPPAGSLPPGAAGETIEAGGRTARFEARAPVEGPWAELAERCRREVDVQVDSPVAAVTAVFGAAGAIRLEHRGREPLTVELSSLAVDLVLWRGGAEVARGRLTGEELGRIEAGPGWSITLEGAGDDLGAEGTLVVVASFVADDGGIDVPVAITVVREAKP